MRSVSRKGDDSIVWDAVGTQMRQSTMQAPQCMEMEVGTHLSLSRCVYSLTYACVYRGGGGKGGGETKIL